MIGYLDKTLKELYKRKWVIIFWNKNHRHTSITSVHIKIVRSYQFEFIKKKHAKINDSEINLETALNNKDASFLSGDRIITLGHC